MSDTWNGVFRFTQRGRGGMPSRVNLGGKQISDPVRREKGSPKIYEHLEQEARPEWKKDSKESKSYTRARKKCSGCANFIPGERKCTLVDSSGSPDPGIIHADASCTAWTPKT